LKSKIINMVDKSQDAGDQLLQSLLRAEPIADGGFSDRIVRRIRRRRWLRRLTLPIAVGIGGLIAFKPAAVLLEAIVRILTSLPRDILPQTPAWLPDVHLLVPGILLFALAMVTLRTLED
jgi:hypothetical protein